MPFSDRGGVEDFAGGKAKILLMGPPKSGKTWAAVLTSPKPVFVINADGGGLGGVSKRVKFDGKDFDGEDVFSERDLSRVLEQLRKDGKHWRTIVLDTVTLLSKHLEFEFKRRFPSDSRKAYGALAEVLLSAISQITQMPAHVVVTGHVFDAQPDTGDLGTLPAIAGQSKTYIPATLQDWLWLEVTPEKNGTPTKREFLLGPQGNWKHGCRSIVTTGKMDADVTAFIRKAGMKP